MNDALIRRWEHCKSDFLELSKKEFDDMVKAGKFAEGPIKTGLSAFMREFGPYSPERWAFGKLCDGRLVCAKIQPLH